MPDFQETPFLLGEFPLKCENIYKIIKKTTNFKYQINKCLKIISSKRLDNFSVYFIKSHENKWLNKYNSHHLHNILDFELRV